MFILFSAVSTNKRKSVSSTPDGSNPDSGKQQHHLRRGLLRRTHSYFKAAISNHPVRATTRSPDPHVGPDPGVRQRVSHAHAVVPRSLPHPL